jgi:uncharacterized membrane protein
MATITITRLHTLLANKLGNDTAENLTTYISETIKEEVKDATSENATKDFVAKVVAESKMDMIKWFIGIFLAWAAMIIGLYFRK